MNKKSNIIIGKYKLEFISHNYVELSVMYGKSTGT